MSETSYITLAEFIEKEAEKIREIEKKANSVLYDNKDEDSYREFMRSKALNLSSLAGKGKALVDLLNEEDKNIIADRLGAFSGSASRSLEVGSIFFMSALLYPEGYKYGDLNDLESFAAEVRAMSAYKE